MATPETVLIGDRVRYESAAGTICGEVVKIMRAPNAAGELINWIYVEYYNEKSPCKYSISRLAETSLEMMKFVISDYEDTRNEKAAA
jgi:ribosome recycling factor